MFLTSLELGDRETADMWVVLAPLIWQDQLYGRIEVPAGFLTDLATIPHMLRAFSAFDPNGDSRRPAVVHDWLYAERSHGKEFADQFLRAALLSVGISLDVAMTFYEAVRDFGAAAWNSDAGALQTRDFDTPEHYQAWAAAQTSAGQV